ncbi:YkgJ family cysteine cluster protein [Pectobacterium cacticida]|uniref:YkgJ family cysteine cluster protein n=1 Tax=Pectobacterium cacticida TaxID=69221 RepID=UPI00398821B4
MSDNVCMHCGACCGFFRVSFYWAEADDGGGLVPSQLTEPLTPFLCCMVGTNSKKPRCQALEGRIGDAVRCAIYDNRPSPCREFMPSGENGQINEACDRARASYGLPPLAPLQADSGNTGGQKCVMSSPGCHNTD